MLQNNIEKLKQELGDNVKLVAVTKKQDIETIKKAKELGLDCFAENRVKAAEEKIPNIDAEWHMIGNLQSNKVKRAVKIFDVIQSVNSESKAMVIDKEAGRLGKRQNVMIQLNIGREEQKYGIDPDHTLDFIKTIRYLGNINIIGLMCIAPLVEDPEEARPHFKKMKELFDQTDLEYLSMGMTNDYKVAIEEGSNMVRIGRLIFQ